MTIVESTGSSELTVDASSVPAGTYTLYLESFDNCSDHTDDTCVGNTLKKDTIEIIVEGWAPYFNQTPSDVTIVAGESKTWQLTPVTENPNSATVLFFETNAILYPILTLDESTGIVTYNGSDIATTTESTTFTLVYGLQNEYATNWYSITVYITNIITTEEPSEEARQE